MIKLEDCKHRYTYRISSRNLIYGVFNKSVNGFVGIREKHGREYLFTEYHHDTGAPYGTVEPLEALQLSEVLDLSESFKLSRKYLKPVVTVWHTSGPLYEERLKKNPVAKYCCESRYFNDEPLEEDDEVVYHMNVVLFNHLKSIEAKYKENDEVSDVS